jgi:Protein of unknown function (DUF3224)
VKNSIYVVAKASRRFGTIIGLGLSITVVSWACIHPLIAAAFQKGPSMNHVSGTFEVKLVPQTDDKNGDATLGRMTIDKQFHGDLEGTSKGQMLTGMTDVKGSAGYVAIEKVSGTLKGRTGTFILQHTGTMNRGVPQLTVTVVPDSGTGQLAGIAGNFTIKIDEGKHSYTFDYTLPESH